jgi:hypothetical protein
LLTFLDQPAETRVVRRRRLINGLVEFTLGGVAALVAGMHPGMAPAVADRMEQE